MDVSPSSNGCHIFFFLRSIRASRRSATEGDQRVCGETAKTPVGGSQHPPIVGHKRVKGERGANAGSAAGRSPSHQLARKDRGQQRGGQRSIATSFSGPLSFWLSSISSANHSPNKMQTMQQAILFFQFFSPPCLSTQFLLIQRHAIRISHQIPPKGGAAECNVPHDWVCD